jgi:hypothetical protein
MYLFLKVSFQENIRFPLSKMFSSVALQHSWSCVAIIGIYLRTFSLILYHWVVPPHILPASPWQPRTFCLCDFPNLDFSHHFQQISVCLDSIGRVWFILHFVIKGNSRWNKVPL